MMIALARPCDAHYSVAVRFDQKTKSVGIRLRGVCASGTRVTGIATATQRVNGNQSVRLRRASTAMKVGETNERRCGQEQRAGHEFIWTL
jgi:hypothetical protein